MEVPGTSKPFPDHLVSSQLPAAPTHCGQIERLRAHSKALQTGRGKAGPKPWGTRPTVSLSELRLSA